MKRDFELLRKILLNVEADQYPYGGRVHIEGAADEIVGRHVALLLDAGLVEGRLITTSSHGIVGASIDRLTNSGHDFVDGIKQDTLWQRAKDHLLKPGAEYGLSILVEWVKLQVHQRIFSDTPHT